VPDGENETMTICPYVANVGLAFSSAFSSRKGRKQTLVAGSRSDTSNVSLHTNTSAPVFASQPRAAPSSHAAQTICPYREWHTDVTARAPARVEGDGDVVRNA
jgi:hypothetical protein